MQKVCFHVTGTHPDCCTPERRHQNSSSFVLRVHLFKQRHRCLLCFCVSWSGRCSSSCQTGNPSPVGLADLPLHVRQGKFDQIFSMVRFLWVLGPCSSSSRWVFTSSIFSAWCCSRRGNAKLMRSSAEVSLLLASSCPILSLLPHSLSLQTSAPSDSPQSLLALHRLNSVITSA